MDIFYLLVCSNLCFISAIIIIIIIIFFVLFLILMRPQGVGSNNSYESPHVYTTLLLESSVRDLIHKREADPLVWSQVTTTSLQMTLLRRIWWWEIFFFFKKLTRRDSNPHTQTVSCTVDVLLYPFCFQVH